MLVALAAACRAQPGGGQASRAAAFAPAETRTLKSFGAAGDGRADDTAALERAFAHSDRYCLDGGGGRYRVVGTLRVSNSLCLRNAILVQSARPADTSPYIVRRCPAVPDPVAVVDCNDPAVPADKLAGLWESLSIRTLLIRPEGDHPVQVSLERVKIDRGPYAEQGSRSDSAGVWLDGADRVDMRDVEITGNGKGYGLQITNSRNISLDNLWVHDLVWAPYRGDQPLTQSRVAAMGWNSVPIHEFREQRPGGAKIAKFYGVRIQEQLTCVSLANVSHVTIRNVRIERCMARFDTGDVPWQADGLDIGQSSSDITVNSASIDSTWEGMDVVGGGNGIDRLQIDGLTVSNAFSFGLKMGYSVHDARVSHLKVNGAGLSGVVLYGPVRDVRIAEASIDNIGTVHGSRGDYSPWPPGNRAGIRIDSSGGSSPEDVVIQDVTVSGRPSQFEFGILNTGGRRVQLSDFRAGGYGTERARGLAGPE